MNNDIKTNLDIIQKSIQWADRFGKDSFPREVFKDYRRRLKRIADALSDNCSAAAYGESQVGKSYLMSSLLSSPDTPFVIQNKDMEYSFIDQINPSGGNNTKQESTGVITRFTIRKSQEHLADLVKVKNLSVVDIILLLTDSYYNDVKINTDNVLASDDINEALKDLSVIWESKAQRQNYICEDDVRDIYDYLHDIIGNNTAAICKSNFRKIVSPVIQYVPYDKWVDVFSLLWNKNPNYNRLFTSLINEYSKIGFATDIYIPFDAVLRDKGTLLKIEWLDAVCGINHELANGEEAYTDIYDISGNKIASDFSKGYLSALIGELTFVLPESIAKDRKFLKKIDLLDFPGARSRERIKEDELQTVLPVVLRRGKVAYLFNKYSRSLKISAVLFCHHNDQKTEPTLGSTIEGWINDNIGETPEQRVEMLKRTNGIAPLFMICTKFNIDLEKTKNDSDISKLDAHWARFKTIIPEMIKEKWLDNWLPSGVLGSKYFQNIYLLRDFYWSSKNQVFGGDGRDRDNVIPSEKIETPDGRTIDNNGSIRGIVGDDGLLPNENVIAPIVGDDGNTPPVVENPGAPDIVSDRLNIYFENEQVDLNEFAADLNKAFPSGECEVVGVDHNVPMLQIRVPSDLRNQIREVLPSKLPKYKFFVVDESIFSIVGYVSEEQDPGWHLKAINLRNGWNYTKGSKDIVVAVVDDGIDADHEILKGRIFKPYNVFTRDNHLGYGDGHGTHVAGLAVGSDKHFDKGVSGVAPKCSLMPVQVFDNGMCTFSSVTSGIMYAIHNGANVVNVSIAPNFKGLDILPLSDQDLVARTQFKNEEKVWRRMIQVANNKNVIIVFAVGNDNIIASIPPENRTNSTVNVAAVAGNFKETDFTNYGKGANVSAPGKGIVSSIPTNQYAVFDGTSMAAPIVAGTIALMKSIDSDVTVSEALTILQRTGRTISEYVPPMVQVDHALEMLKSGMLEAVPSNDSDEADDNQDVPSGSNVNPNRLNEDGSTPSGNEGTDYDSIRKMIEFYKHKISELEKLLPENKK